MESVHFIGIGGVGMNGLAQLAAMAGYAVSGSDRAYCPDAEPFQTMEKLGIEIHAQDGSGVSASTDRVVYSTAIEADNPDLVSAKHHGIPLLHRADFLKMLVGDADLVAVAGTAGKTTTTGLLGWIFECLGHDPFVYNGAAVLNWKTSTNIGNVRKGKSDLWIIEADESDRSFLTFHPTHSVITNISKDHYELDELHKMFDQFGKQTRGIVVEGSTTLPKQGSPHSFSFQGLEFHVPMIGRHNLDNALCAVKLCSALGLDLEKVQSAIRRFKGIERRLEKVGEVEGITVIDDYAHNPVKIAASLSASTGVAKCLHAFWRPHGYGPLHHGFNNLLQTFSGHWRKHGGSISILPVYFAGGTVERKTSSEELVAALNSSGVPAEFVPDYGTLKHALEQRAEAGDAILGMGARDPELPRFARRLVTEWKSIQ